MLKTLRNAWKIKEIRTKLIFTFLMLVVIRFGSELPIPGVKTDFFANFFANQSTDAFGFFNAMTGGSFSSMSIFALSITPYITSSIIMQLLTIAIPKLEEMQRDGEDGRKKIAEYTRYLTVGLALIESIGMAVGFGGQGLLINYNVWSVVIAVATMTAGSAFLMWIGERITEKGVGNGISIVLLFNIVSSLPQDVNTLYTRFLSNSKNIGSTVLIVLIMLAVTAAMVVFVIILQDGERRIPVQYSKKMVGRKLAKQLGAHVMAEVTPHHFSLDESAVLKHGTLAKMNPPLRTIEDKEEILRGLKEGVIDIIATDHAPHSAEEKAKPLTEAPSGIIGLETALALGVTNLVREDVLTMPQLMEKMSLNPAILYHLEGNKGHLSTGADADLVLFDPNEKWTVKEFKSKATNSPFIGEELYGKVKYTICGGKIAYKN